MTFFDYMMEYHKGEDSPAGDLAEDMYSDHEEFPVTEEDRDKVDSYLIRCGACRGCIDTFHKCWNRYQRMKKKMGKETDHAE